MLPTFSTVNCEAKNVRATVRKGESGGVFALLGRPLHPPVGPALLEWSRGGGGGRQKQIGIAEEAFRRMQCAQDPFEKKFPSLARG